MTSLRCPGEVEGFSYGEYVAHLLEFHSSIVHHDGFNEKYVLDFLIVLRDRKGMSTRTGTWPVGRAGRVLATAFAPVAWGTTYIVTTGLLPGGHPMFAALMRSLPVGVVVVLVARSLPKGK